MAFLSHRGQGYIEWGMKGTGPLQQSLARPFVVPAARPQTKEQSAKLSSSFPQAPQAATPLDCTRDHQAQGPVSTGNAPGFHSSSWN